MKRIVTGILTTILLISFTGCGKTPKPFNKNNTILMFKNGKPYKVPAGSYIQTLKKLSSYPELIDIFDIYGPNNCNTNSLIWYYPSLDKHANSLFKVFFYYINDGKHNNWTFQQLIDEIERIKYSSNIPISVLNSELDFIKKNILKRYSKNPKLFEMSKENYINYLLTAGDRISKWMIRLNHQQGQCIDPMSDREYQYYLNKQSTTTNSNISNGNSSLSEFNNSLNQLNNSQRQQNANTQNYIDNNMYSPKKKKTGGIIIKTGNIYHY